MEEGLFHNPVFVQYVNENAVAAVGHMEGHAEVERMNPVTGATEKVCPVYNTVPCAAHQAVYRQAAGGGKFEFRGVPSSFVADSFGKKLFEVNGSAPQQFIDKLTEAQRQSGKRPILGSQIQRWSAKVIEGDRHVHGNKFKEARAAYQKVAEDEDVPEFIRARAREKVEELPAKIAAAIDAAKGLPANNAKRELKKLVKALKDFPDELKAAEEALASVSG